MEEPEVKSRPSLPWGLPRWHSGEEYVCQHRRGRLHPWGSPGGGMAPHSSVPAWATHAQGSRTGCTQSLGSQGQARLRGSASLPQAWPSRCDHKLNPDGDRTTLPAAGGAVTWQRPCSVLNYLTYMRMSRGLRAWSVKNKVCLLSRTGLPSCFSTVN